jgi:SRSO17 transposase
MTEQQLRELGPALSAFLDRFLFCCGYTQTFAHLGTYVHGLLSELPRKSVEPIALQAGTPVRTLQEFLRDHAWDYLAVRDLLQRHTADVLGRQPDDALGAVGIVDETSVVKCGSKTPGVQRQYLGCVGKVQNGIVTVHLGVAKGRFKTLIDAELYLPENWAQDRPRCRAAGIPDEVSYRPKWQIALEQIDRARANGAKLDWLTFDEGYGQRPAFLAALDQRQQLFVGEVPRTCSCLAVNRAGGRPEGTKGRPAEEVVRASSLFRSQRWQVLRLARQTLAGQAWRVKAARVWLSARGGWSAGHYWLIWASSDHSGEEKFFLSNAPPDAAVALLVGVAFRRFNVEHGLRVCKGELGFGHFEGRSYVALMRHLSLCLVAMSFVAEHTERLRGEKRGADPGAALPGAAATEPGMAAHAATDERAGLRLAYHRLSPGAQPRRPGGQATKAGRGPAAQEAPPAQTKTT